MEQLLRAIERVGAEMAERDGELRDVLARVAEMRGSEAARPDDAALAALLHSVANLATVTEASVDRAADLSRSLQRLVETVSSLSQRVDRLAAQVAAGNAAGVADVPGVAALRPAS